MTGAFAGKPRGISGRFHGIVVRLTPPRSAVALGGALVLFAAAPAASARTQGGAAQARDVAATRAYVEADYRLARAGRANLSASAAAVRALVHRTVSECPLAGEGAYVNHAANQVSEEVLGTVEVTAYQPDRGAIDAATLALKHLRWSNGALTRRVQTFVVKLEKLVAITPANICVDVKAYAATAFVTAPETTVSFITLFHAAEAEPEEVPPRLLARYEGPRQVKLMHAVKRIESALAESEAHAVEQWMGIMRGLDLSV